MIKISVPNDDHVALRAMAKALEEIAVARGAPLQVNLVTQEMLDKLKETRSGNIVCEPEVDTISQQFESLNVKQDLSTGDTELPSVASSTPHPADNTDSTGTPWDERIHSASKALNSDGTWRVRRKPKNMDEAEWSAFVQNVQDELLGQKPGDLTPDDPEWESFDEHSIMEEAAKFDESEPAVTPEGDDFHVDAGVVTEQQVASFPPPPPVPNLQVGSPVPPAQTIYVKEQEDGTLTPTMTFPQVMAFLTERHGRITSAQVDQIIADMGLEKITDLNTQPEHTGPFIARVKALLGE